MRYFFLMVLTILFSTTSYAQPQKVGITKMQDHYFVGNEDDLEKGINCFVITERKEYEKFFGTTSRPDTPKFQSEWMLVMVMPMTHWESDLSFNRISVKAGDFIEVYCSMDTRKHPLTYEYNPIAAVVIPKHDNVNKVDFYEEHKGAVRLMQSVAIKRRY